MKRNPVVAGSFYPGYANILRREIEQYLANINNQKTYSDLLGVISPHAGYVYSGQCAAHSYRVLQQRSIKYAVIIAPSHRFASFKYSVGNFESYLTPLGEVTVAEEITSKLLKNGDFCFHRTAHQSEHSLEVQLPFLQVVAPEIRLVPILIGSQLPENSEVLAKILVDEFSKKLEETVFIISTDLSHYYPAEIAEKKDQSFIDILTELDIDKMNFAYRENRLEACGIGGVFSLMYMAKMLGYAEIDVLNYVHSGHISGEMAQVVGYLSAVVYK